MRIKYIYTPGFNGIAQMKEEGEPVLNVHMMDNTKPLEEKIKDICEYTKLNIQEGINLTCLLEALYKLPKNHVRKRKKIFKEISDSRDKMWGYNAMIRHVARNIYIRVDDESFTC